MSSSNNTVSWCISDMPGDVLKQLLLCIQASELYALQLDESTEVAGLAQLLVYVRYIYGRSIKEDILFCKPLETRTTWEDIFKVLDSFVTSNGLWWLRCVGVCSDGAKAMTGRHSGVVTRLQAISPNATWVHCRIHKRLLLTRECLTAWKAFWTLQWKWLTLLKQGLWTLMYFLHYATILAAAM